MFTNQSVRWRGLTELNRDLGRFDRSLQRELQAGIRALAEPAAAKIKEAAAERHFSAATIEGIRPGSRRGVAIVQQRRGKTTGMRPDFGGIEFRLAFIPGADKAEPLVHAGLELFLDRLASKNGLGMGGRL